MSKLIGFGLLVMGTANIVFGAAAVAPEIDGSSAVTAVVLLSGGLLVLRSRRKK